MAASEFFDSETTWKAYLGKHAFDLLTLSSKQAAVLYKDRGLIFPIEVSSTLQFLLRKGVLSVADVAKSLDLPHQLATQRVEKLVKLGLLRRKPDPADGRRMLLHLTKKGREQAAVLEQCMADVAQLYEELFEEIGCDLSKTIPAATAALQSTSLAERMSRRQAGTGTKKKNS